MAKSGRQLDREIADALRRKSSSSPRVHQGTFHATMRKLKMYKVEARIISGNDDATVWEGSFELPASSLRAAKSLALDLLHESTYYDPRIDPRAVLDRVEHIGEVEVEPPETPEQVTAELIAEARAEIP